jgi:hypothetical protein
MNLFIVILLMNFVHLFGDKFGSRISKNLLRGAYKEDRERQSLKWFELTFDNIFDKIIESAKTGKNEYQFTIMCYPLEYSSNENCEIRNIGERKEWTNDHPFITKKQFITNVLDALQNSFPDSNFTKSYKNCCEHYSIEW